MRDIDIQTWSRRDHFNLFSGFDHPYFNMCANVDLTAFSQAVKQRNLSFTVALVYVLARAANDIPEFRTRMRPGKVVMHEMVHPSITLLVGDDLFSFCHIHYVEDFVEFAIGATESIARHKTHPTLKDDPGQDNLLFMTAIPWVSFTSFMHPMHRHPPDSVPRFAWGKTFEEGTHLKMPLSVQGHHALMDGLHMGRYYAAVQDYLNCPDDILGNV